MTEEQRQAWERAISEARKPTWCPPNKVPTRADVLLAVHAEMEALRARVQALEDQIEYEQRLQDEGS